MGATSAYFLVKAQCYTEVAVQRLRKKEVNEKIKYDLISHLQTRTYCVKW